MKNKKTLYLFGAIAGLIVVAGMFVTGFLFLGEDDKGFANGELLGYTTMIIALSMVFFGVKSYRDKVKNGVINFQEAFLNGLIIVLVASVFYVVGWEIYFPNFMPDFTTEYVESQMDQYLEEGMSEEDIKIKKDEMAKWMESYKNPLIRMPITFLEIFPVGLIIALFSALILKRKP